MADNLATVFWLAVLCVVGYTVLRTGIAKQDAARRRAEAEAYDRRLEEKAKAALLADIDRYFPFLRAPFQVAVGRGVSVEAAFWTALEGISAVELGTTFYDLPARLPLAERRKHLYVVGKTGSGKTTLLLHLVKADLEAGRGIAVIAPEAELFRDWLLGLVPDKRLDDVVYFAPGHPKNPVTFNPLAVEDREDCGRAAEDLFAIFKRAVGEDEFGARMAPILGNAFAALTGRPGATLWDVKRLLEDRTYQGEIAASLTDEYLRDFWLKTFPGYPKGAHLPLVNRLDQFLRPRSVRRALCQPTSTLSIRRVLAEGQILFVDLSGLAPDSMLLLGQMIMAAFQLQLMKRESIPEEFRTDYALYADEFAATAGAAEETWRELLSRGRRYGLALTLAHQHPSQLSAGLQDEILGNVASVATFGLSAKDAQIMRREFLEAHEDGARPVAAESLISLRPGRAVARLGSGAYAIPLATKPPLEAPPPWRGETAKERSWQRYGEKGRSPSEDRSHRADGREPPPDDFLE